MNGKQETAIEDSSAGSQRDFQRAVRGRNAGGGAGSFAAIKRTWMSGDKVEVGLPFALRVEAFKDNPDRFAFLSGPLVLAGEVDTRKPFPAIVAEKESALASLKPVASRANTLAGPAEIFRIPGEKNGGVGQGVSPKTALSVGLKVDADALPKELVGQIKAGKVNLDDPATTVASSSTRLLA